MQSARETLNWQAYRHTFAVIISDSLMLVAMRSAPRLRDQPATIRRWPDPRLDRQHPI
jgi:hypothetical protein